MSEVPVFYVVGRNRSKGLYVEYKGIQYPIDRKGTQDDIDARSVAWEDDTVTVGTIVISLKDYFAAGSNEERKKLFDSALGGTSGDIPKTDDELDKDDDESSGTSETSGRSGQFGNVSTSGTSGTSDTSGKSGTDIIQNSTSNINVNFDLEFSKDPSPGKVKINILIKTDGSLITGDYDENDFANIKTLSLVFDDKGYVVINGIKYSAKQIINVRGTGTFLPGSREGISAYDDLKGSTNADIINLLKIWDSSNTNQSDTPDDENPATNNVDPEQKFEPKLKENEAPQGAPQNVENSAALTTSKLRALEGQTVKPGASINMWDSFINYKVPKFSTSLGYFGIRDQKAKTLGLGKLENEYKTESKLIGAVKSYFNSNWSELITGAPIPVAKKSEELNLIDYPIIMNFTEVGVWNKKVPYVADTQTEQHRMLYISYSNSHNMGKWGIGSYDSTNGGFANWAEQPHWCGIFTQHCISHGGYTLPGIKVSLAGANNINNVYFNSALVKLKEKKMDAEQSLGNIPTYIDSAGQQIPHGDLLKLKVFGNGSGTNYKTPIYGMLLDTSIYKELSESNVTMVPTKDGKKLKPNIKKTMTREKIPIVVRESFLPNPIMVYFIAGYHFTTEGLTPQGKKLIEHLLSQRDWEVAIISRGGHIEVCPYINPDGTIARFGGNTGNSNVVSRDGGKFAARASSISAFSSGAKAGSYVCFTKVVPKAGSQKIEPTLNGQFRRTPIVDSYYRSINGKTVLPTLKNVLYDTIVEKE